MLFSLRTKRLNLQVQESWDKCFEVGVMYLWKKKVCGLQYYAFLDLKGRQVYLLAPRYNGERIEKLTRRSWIIVNVYWKMANRETRTLDRHGATGTLRIIE
jgi:hypothetical protein